MQAEGQRFLLLDHHLDKALSGPTWLNQPEIAECVIETLLVASEAWKLCDLFAWVIMSNHVHALLMPQKPLADVTRAIKKTSARRANLILGRTGLPFWQDESFDHWVRNDREFDKLKRYIEENPVKAGLVEAPTEWPWSSASLSLPHGRSGTCPTC